MTRKRKAMTKRTRFEVFKRDKFACQYCGRKAPEVLLRVDHIEPHSKGGS
jgi:5-methylcytosine-specific restriction endonuclease McrA